MAAGDLGEGVVPELAERASSHDTKTTAHCEIGHARQLRDVVGLRQHEKQSWRRGLNELMLIWVAVRGGRRAVGRASAVRSTRAAWGGRSMLEAAAWAAVQAARDRTTRWKEELLATSDADVCAPGQLQRC
jgi:hypothetical protein